MRPDPNDIDIDLGHERAPDDPSPALGVIVLLTLVIAAWAAIGLIAWWVIS